MVTIFLKTIEQDAFCNPGVLHTPYSGMMELTAMPSEASVGSITLGVGTEKVYD